jgi:hypothetical protein
MQSQDGPAAEPKTAVGLAHTADEPTLNTAVNSCLYQLEPPPLAPIGLCLPQNRAALRRIADGMMPCCVCRPDSVIIWTRFTPENSSAVPVAWHMSTRLPDAAAGASTEGSVAVRSALGDNFLMHLHCAFTELLSQQVTSLFLPVRLCKCQKQHSPGLIQPDELLTLRQ